MQTFRFTVTGRGGFPLDMLRYDACFPCHPGAVANIEVTPEDKAFFATRSVTLEHSARAGERGWHPTEGRWSSFGWDVTQAEDAFGVTLDYARMNAIPGGTS